MSDLREKIEQLIALKKEGDYWDFKLKHHDNAADLVLDIICLANAVRHKGDRFLIFGIDPVSYEPKGIEGTTPIRTQADIITTLRNAGFANQSFPDIELEKLQITDQGIEVIIIADKSDKPYYLEKDYKHNGTTVRAGVVYSRIQDTNTPQNGVATPIDIEKMWRQRFGLDGPPIDRLKNYLSDFDGWEELDENNWHYKQFPEFTICPTEEDKWEVEAGENWVRACPNPRAFVRPMVAKFDQTTIAKVCCIYFDEMRGLIPAPHNTFVKGSDNQWFYSFSADDPDFLFLQFFTHKSRNRLLNQELSGGRAVRLPIIVFSSDKEKNDFIHHLRENPVQILPEHQFTRHANDPTISEQDCLIVTYCRAVVAAFTAWKNVE